MDLADYKKIHLIGIGGVGMSAIAWILLKMGFKVSGSDLSENRMTVRLRENGATIYSNHSSNNVSDVDLVVISSAIKESNPEYKTALENKLPILHRSDILAWILNTGKSITIAGTHGKTTTTSMVSMIYEYGGFDPIILIGGEVNDFGGNAKYGKGGYIIAEADESDGSFIKYDPFYSIVTNIEADHLDYYHDYDTIIRTFKQFISQTQTEGCVFLCIDDPGIKSLRSEITNNYKTFSVVEKKADFFADNINIFFGGSSYTFVREGKILGEVSLSVPGIHNVSNSLAAIGTALEEGIPFEKIPPILKMFRGVRRRFEIKGTSRGITVIDDYAHHPTEISVTLKALQNIPNDGRAFVIFQPHRYSRTQALAGEFAASLGITQNLILTDVYSAGEQPINGINGETIYDLVRDKESKNVKYVKDKNQISDMIIPQLTEGDVVITIGAGDVYKIGEKILNKLNEQSLVNT